MITIEMTEMMGEMTLSKCVSKKRMKPTRPMRNQRMMRYSKRRDSKHCLKMRRTTKKWTP